MSRDTDEALQKLQEALFAEEPQEEEDTFLEEADMEALSDDDLPADEPIIYQNYSNRYGQDLRNYATGYKIYNSDKTDTDLDTFSETVRESENLRPRRRGLLAALLFLLTAAVVAALLLYLYKGGFF